MESILCEAIKLEFEAYTSVNHCSGSSRELNEVGYHFSSIYRPGNDSKLSPNQSLHFQNKRYHVMLNESQILHVQTTSDFIQNLLSNFLHLQGKLIPCCVSNITMRVICCCGCRFGDVRGAHRLLSCRHEQASRIPEGPKTCGALSLIQMTAQCSATGLIYMGRRLGIRSEGDLLIPPQFLYISVNL